MYGWYVYERSIEGVTRPKTVYHVISKIRNLKSSMLSTWLCMYVNKNARRETTFTKLLSLLIISPNSFRSFAQSANGSSALGRSNSDSTRHSTSGMQCNSNQPIKHFLRVPARGGDWRDPMMELGWVWGRKSLPDKSFCENAANGGWIQDRLVAHHEISSTQPAQGSHIWQSFSPPASRNSLRCWTLRPSLLSWPNRAPFRADSWSRLFRRGVWSYGWRRTTGPLLIIWKSKNTPPNVMRSEFRTRIRHVEFRLSHGNAKSPYERHFGTKPLKNHWQGLNEAASIALEIRLSEYRRCETSM
jgi:hypothetical protein